MKKIYKYYIRKFQQVTAQELPDANRLKEACIRERKVISFLYFPLFVRHDLYSTPEIAEICYVLTNPPETEFIVSFSGLPEEKVNAAIANKVFLTLERDEPVLDESGQPRVDSNRRPFTQLVRRRFGLWFSKYDASSEDVVSRLSTISNVTFKEDDGPSKTWRVVGVYFKSVFRSLVVRNEAPVEGQAPNREGAGGSRRIAERREGGGS